MDPVVTAGVLRNGTDRERYDRLGELREPIAPELIDAVIDAIDRGGVEVRERAVWRLARSTWKVPDTLDESRVSRILAVALRERHGEMFRALLSARPLPRADDVAVAVFESGLQEAAFVRDVLCTCARDGRIGSEAALRILALPLADEARLLALRPVEVVYERTGDRRVQQDVLRMLLSPNPVALRREACWVLRRAEKEGPASAIRVSLSADGVRNAFGAPRNALIGLASLLRDHATMLEVGVFDWVSDLLGYRTEPDVVPLFESESRAFHEFLDAVIGIVKGDYWPILRRNAARSLGILARGEEREFVIAALAEVPRGDFDLDYWLDRVPAELRGDRRD